VSSATGLLERLRWVGDRELLDRVLSTLEEAEARGRSVRGVQRFGHDAFFFKSSPLATKSALRHGLRQRLGISEIPRLQEFANLTWLLRNGFAAPPPRLAGVLSRAGLPRYQFLLTEFQEDAPTLEEFCASSTERVRAPVLSALAQDLARMHQLGFVHRDLFARNLIVCRPPEGLRCAFLDAWRGGPRPGWRGPFHDLGCFFLDASSLLESREQALFLATYREERVRLGGALPVKWLTRVQRARRSTYRREKQRHPGRNAVWDPPVAT